MGLSRRRLLSGLLLVAALAIGPRSQAAPRADAAPPAPLRIDFVSVGQGDAALVTSPTGKVVLIDGGPKEAGATLTALLRSRHVDAIDLVVLTHRHEDHLGGLLEIVRAFPVRMFMDAPYRHDSEVYRRLENELGARHVQVRNAERGRTIDIGGGAVLTLLTPPDPPIARSRSDVNANGVVARLDYGKVGVLFAADAEPQTERWLLASAARLPAQILKVAHHGGRYSSTAPFLRAVAPLAAVISVGAVNAYGHPTAQALSRLDRQGARVYRTDRDGTITAVTDGARIEMTTAAGRRAILAAQ